MDLTLCTIKVLTIAITQTTDTPINVQVLDCNNKQVVIKKDTNTILEVLEYDTDTNIIYIKDLKKWITKK